jgi:CheY-like chemotaxis protein
MKDNGQSYSLFVVEDETLIRMMIVEMLEELGHTVTNEAARLDQAISLARSADFDLALLDVNLGGQLVTPVAEIIELRKLPIIFSTGYAADAIPVSFRERALIRKPFGPESLETIIKLTMAGASEALSEI